MNEPVAFLGPSSSHVRQGRYIIHGFQPPQPPLLLFIHVWHEFILLARIMGRSGVGVIYMCGTHGGSENKASSTQSNVSLQVT